MDPLLSWMRLKQKELIAFLREMVECESPSDDASAVDRMGELFADRVAGIAKVKRLNGSPYGRHLVCEFSLPGRNKNGQILALGHSDTVWPLGTLRTMPWREEKGRLWGPGVLDMKAGLSFFVYAVKALRELEVPVSRRVLLQINSDEEVGSHT
jgi:glutamate carboxypeptidase